ncbi:hypothetical protein SteCoe_18668 [Stentor coeruleus]|uniref:Protein-tyrosine-phosphatase n=1 Tax=Stentor coeruleus TaxID=5963 RepID=A0A1R2BW88_9CILI|nr:hypothetical protein SteCoe_18668 [Stentor coeruleus]
MELSENLNKEPTNDQAIANIMKQIRMFLALKYVKTDNIPAEVVPGVYIGSIGAAMCKGKLKEVGITHILCVADSISPVFPEDFTYKIVKILDSPDVKIIDYLSECFDFISSALATGRILIHCFAGKSRSASVVIGYLMKINLWTFEQALEYLREKRSIVDPNPGFASQLRALNYIIE